jgi:RHS repeat-associated protein
MKRASGFHATTIHQCDGFPRALRTSVLCAFSLALAVSVVSSGEIQNDQIGFSTNHVFESALTGENIDVMTGNLTLTIPLGPKFMLNDHFGYQMTLYYNSKLWEHDCSLVTPPNPCLGTLMASDTYGLGFRLGFGRIYQRTSIPADKSFVFRYQTPDGAEHFFCDHSGHHWEMLDDPNASNEPLCTQGYTLDGSGIKVDPTAGGWEVYPGDGTKITFTARNNGPVDVNGWYATKIEDVSNPTQYVTIAYTPSGGVQHPPDLATVADSLGREIRYTPEVYPSIPATLTLPAFAGMETYASDQKATYTFTFSRESVHDPVDAAAGSYSLKFLTKISYPVLNPTAEYQGFSYFGSGDVLAAGYLTGRHLPTGADVDYYYAWYPTSPKRPYHIELFFKELFADGKGTSGGRTYRWSWSRFGDGVIRGLGDLGDPSRPGSLPASNPQQVKVLDPFDNLTEYWFGQTVFGATGCNSLGDCTSGWQDGLLYHVFYYSGADDGATRLVKQVSYDYHYAGRMFQYRATVCGAGCEWPHDVNSIAVDVRTTEERTTYAGGGEYPDATRKVVYSDWTTESPGACPGITCITKPKKVTEYDGEIPYRSTWTEYEPTPEFHDGHRFVEVRDSMGEVVSRTDRHFTRERLDCEVARNGTAGDDSLACNQIPTNLSAGDVATTYSYDSAGNPSSTTVQGGDDGGSWTTSYTYCAGGYLCRKDYDGISWDALDRDIDFNSGLVIASRDPAGTATSYDWDKLGRLKSISPALPELPTTISYPSLLQTTVTRTVASNDFTQMTYLYDNLGRQVGTQRRDLVGSSVSPPSYDFQKTKYDVAGRVLCRTEWADKGTADADLQWTTYSYLFSPPSGSLSCVEALHVDPLGRVHKVTKPDGSATETAYAGLATMVTVSNIRGVDAYGQGTWETVTTTRVNDGLGRLVKVIPRENSVSAKYSYDELDNLVEVDFGGRREFSFDHLGRLRRATNPENGTVEYLSYDARGNLLQFKDARQGLFVNAYDAASRLTQRSIRVDGTDQVLVENTYDTDLGGGSGAVNGKLTYQVTYKLLDGISTPVAEQRFDFGPPNGGSPCDSGYLGLNGRLARHHTFIEPLPTDIATEYCQNSMGLDSLIAYPDSVGSGRTRSRLFYQYKNGFLWEMHDWDRNFAYVSDASYGPNGNVKEIIRGNGLRDAVYRDVMARPGRITALRGATAAPHAMVHSPSQRDPIPVGGDPGLQMRQESNDPDELATEQSLPILWDSGVYAYDGAGNVKWIYPNSYFFYDELSRLVKATVLVGSTSYTLAYGYDDYGNRTWDSMTPGSSRNYLISPAYSNRVSVLSVSGNDQTSYQYDENGNVVSEIRYLHTPHGDLYWPTGYTYDVQNRLERVSDNHDGTTASYDYDANGYRVRVEEGGTETYYYRDPSGQVLSEFRRKVGDSDAAVWDKDYVYVFGKAFGLVKNEVPRSPGKPRAEQVTSTGLTLEWNAVPEPDILGYRVHAVYQRSQEYRATRVDRDISGGATSMADTFPFTAGPESTISYTVTAMDTAANLSDPSSDLLVRPGSTDGPPTPTGLTAEAGDRRVYLRWNAIYPRNEITGQEDDDIRGYFVEKKSSPTGSWTRVTSAALGQAEYLDIQVSNGHTYWYRVLAVDTSGRSSHPSGTVSATPYDTNPPARPTGVEAEADREAGKIRLSWRAVLDQDIATYQVYRSETQGVIGPLVATQSGVQYVDPVTVGWTYYYRVRAVDSSDNPSDFSDEVSARPRRTADDFATPTLLSAAYGVNDRGTTSQDGVDDSCDCNVTAEDDDVIRVVVTWTASAGAQGYRIYRADGSSGRFWRIAEVPSSSTSYADTEVPAADYTYYVVATQTIGTVKEESGASATGQATDFFSTDSHLRNLRADYGVAEYSTYNEASRLVRLFWSNVPTSQLLGYHVYRRCMLFDYCGSGGPNEHRVDAFTCEPTWVRLTDGPASKFLRVFEDRTLGGLKGCYFYAIRPVGPDLKEGQVTKILDANLSPQTQLTGTCMSGGRDQYSPEYDGVCGSWQCFPSTAGARDLINARSRGTLSDNGAPGTPQNVHVAWHEKLAPLSGQQRSKYVWVSWNRNQEKDLAGYHVELAGSDAGPWTRATQHPVAWWEDHWASMGLDVKLPVGSTAQYYGKTDCLRFRVVAVDESGNESSPSYPPSSDYPVAGCSAAATLSAPTNLRASTAQNPAPCIEDAICQNCCCWTRLEWDPVPGAYRYNVYRMVLYEGYYFYRTHQQLATAGTTYIEKGDDSQWAYSATEEACPYRNEYGSRTECEMGHLEAYYVTAEGPANGGESARSNMVLWHCKEAPGYAKLWTPDHETGAEILLASMGFGENDGPVCRESPLPFADGTGGFLDFGRGRPVDATRTSRPDVGSTGNSERPVLAIAPFTKLGSFPDPPWALYDLHMDHLGSVRVVTDDEGNVIKQHDFLPFGEDTSTSLDYTTHLFTGHERDAATGLDYMLGRYYSSGLGRFLSTDPVTTIRKNLVRPQRWNRYVYALNNPLKYFDPDGLDVEVATNARSAVMFGYQRSAEFRGQFDAAKNNPDVHVRIASTGPVPGARADLKAEVGPAKDPNTGKPTGKYEVTGTAEIPAGHGDATSAALVGHELKHANDMAQSGPQRKGTPAAEQGQQAAQQTEDQIEEESKDKNTDDDVSKEQAEKALEGTEPKKKVP